MHKLKLIHTASPLGYKNLYRSQQQGITTLYENDAIQFVAPLGYGKTVVAMTAIGELIIDNVIDCAIVVAPKRVAELVWPAERKQWEHLAFLRVKPLTGTPTQRREKLMAEDADIYVIGIDNLPWLMDQLDALPDHHRLLQLICVDEVSRLKSPRGVWSKRLRKSASRFRIRWGLTGTPRPNGYEDQFAPLSFISANSLWGRSYDRWRDEHFYPLDFQRYNWAVRPDHIDILNNDISRYSATVDNSDMPDLPKVITRDHFVDLTYTARRQYDGMEKDLAADDVVAANMGVATIKMAQIVQGFLYGDTPEDTVDLHHAKTDLLGELVESLNGQPVIVVYEFQEDIARLRERWPDLRWLGHNVTSAQADENVALWNKGEVPILAIHPAAAGHGLNLQKGGNQMIFYGMTWSPELYEQTIGRLHRQGQKEHVFVHRILARDTIDQAKIIRVEARVSEQDAFKRYLLRRAK